MTGYLQKVGQKYKSSSIELSKPLNLTVTAMLLALSVVMRYFENNSVLVIQTNLIKIGFTTLPIVVVAILYGPVAAGIVGGLTDVIGYIIVPVGGAYMPGFTISMILMGMIYGIAFYKENVKLPRIIITEVIITLFINIVLGVTWFMLFYGMDLTKALSIRGLKEFFDLPVSVLLNFVVYKAVQRIPEVRRIMKNREKA